MTRYELQKLGEALANEFLQSNSDLTRGLEKVANELNLTEHQVQRVAEFANVETYAKMLEKTAGAEYIKFPIARPELVARQTKEAAAEVEFEYETSYLDNQDIRFWPEIAEETPQVLNQHIDKIAHFSQKVGEAMDIALQLKQSKDQLSKLAQQYLYSHQATRDQLFTAIAAGGEKIAQELFPEAKRESLKVDHNSDLFKLAQKTAKLQDLLVEKTTNLPAQLTELKAEYPLFTKKAEKQFNFLQDYL